MPIIRLRATSVMLLYCWLQVSVGSNCGLLSNVNKCLDIFFKATSAVYNIETRSNFRQIFLRRRDSLFEDGSFFKSVSKIEIV